MSTQTRHMTVGDLAGLRWRGYLRESTQNQADMWSPERQRSDMTRAADELGMVAAEPTWYQRTGTGETRSEELDVALHDGQGRQYDVLVVLTTSRFARNRAEAVRRKAQFSKAGIPIYFVQDRILSGARSSRLLEGVREVIDEEEQETRRFWIAGGHRERQLSGRWIGAIPFGYRKAMADFPDGSRRWDGGLEPDPVEAPLVRRMFGELVAGSTPRDIAFRLNVEGIRNRERPWARGQIVKVLGNPVYVGDLVRYRATRAGHYYDEADAKDGRQTLTDALPALIERPLFESARMLTSERRIAGSARNRTLVYPLSGILRCGGCMRRMSGVSNGTARYYRCLNRAEMGTCDEPFFRASIAEEAFARWLHTLRLPADWRARLAKLPDRDEGADTERRRRLEERTARLRKLYSWGDIGEDEYRAETATIRGEMALVVRPNLGSITAIAEALGEYGRSWLEDASPAKRAIPALMLRDLIVRGGEIVEWVVRAELRPLIELCVVSDPSFYPVPQPYTLRFSA